MVKLVPKVSYLLLVAGMALSASAVSAQQPDRRSFTFQDPPELPAPVPQGSNPVPGDAEDTLLAAFDRYEVVAMSAAHGNKDLDDFILHLLRNRAFPGKVNDVVVECGNSLYQPTLDRYIAGADVPLTEVREVWRNTTQPMCGVSAFYEQLFPLIRRINQTLPPEKKLRVLAGDPPVDWSKITSGRDFAQGRYFMRDPRIASVMEKEVLAKHRKALMLFGTAHLFHVGDTAVALDEKNYPAVTLVIADHAGFGNWTPLAKYNNRFEARLASWPLPSLVANLKGTWLADLLDQTYSSGNIMFGPINSGKLPAGPMSPKGTFAAVPPEALARFSTMVDAYLYLGPRDHLLNEPAPADVVLDRDYMAEVHRRATLTGLITDDADPDQISERDANPFFYDPDELRKFLQPPFTPAFQSLP
ncbi:MAG TPA: hypothetical protein VFO39_20595 [Candidatus Sulfotelmatobacter sp.]|nr:hypothetical protein [Candidatus Sulfotelmatobacter sp.]